MSDQTNPGDFDAEIPEGDALELGNAQAAKRGLSPAVKFGVVVLGALAAITGGVFYTSAQKVAPSSTSRPAALDSTPGGDVQKNSPAYQESVKKMNEERAQRAGQLGVTSVPTPESILKPIEAPVEIKPVQIAPEDKPAAEEAPVRKPITVERRVLPSPQPAPVVETRVRKPIVQDAQSQAAATGDAKKEDENPFRTRMITQMGSLAGAMKVQGMAVSSDTKETASQVDAGADAETAKASSASADDAITLIRPGDVLYAVTLTSVNSDMDSPVMAEVVSGEFKGARMVGSFETSTGSDKMVVAFDNMTLEDGRVLDVHAFAVDGKTAETAVASDVNRRLVARYAPIVAASFISGYAQSAAQTNSTITTDGNGVASDAATATQSLYAGAAAAAGAVSSDLAAWAPKGPKITLRDGYPIGILFVDPVTEK